MYPKEILRQYNVRLNKRLGQNFLISQHYLNRIIAAIDIKPGDHILEVGSGSGNLTKALVENKISVIAVEKDVKLCRILSDIFKENSNLSLINADFLTVDLNRYIKNGSLFRIIGNLPYYISTKILEKIVENRSLIKDGYLMLQKEYVERMLADSGSKTYGRLSIFTQVFLDLQKLFKVPKNCFYPKPKIDSHLISFNIKDNVEINDSRLLSLVTSEFFQKRRKKIGTIIKGSKILTGLNTYTIMYNLGIDLNQRPEQLPVSKYINIIQEMEK